MYNSSLVILAIIAKSLAVEQRLRSEDFSHGNAQPLLKSVITQLKSLKLLTNREAMVNPRQNQRSFIHCTLVQIGFLPRSKELDDTLVQIVGWIRIASRAFLSRKM